MTLEVGKKYIYPDHEGSPFYFIGRAASGLPVFQNNENHVGCYGLPEHRFVEYKEPVVHTRTVVWWRNADGEVRGCTSPVAKDTVADWKARNPGKQFLALERVTYTEK